MQRMKESAVIKVTSYRDKGKGEVMLSSHLRDVKEALKSLVLYELAYGARMTMVAEEQIEVSIRILHNEDRTVFTGPKEEIAALAEAAILWDEVAKEIPEDEIATKVLALSQGNALLVTAAGPIIRGDMILEKLARKIREGR